MSDDLVNLQTGAPVTAVEPPVAPAPESPEPVSERDTVAEAVRAAYNTETAKLEGGDDRPRGPDGKFIPKATVEAATAPDAKPITDRDGKTPPSPAPSTAPAGPPSSWSADAKASWASLSPATQAAVLKRETEVSDGFRQKSEEAKAYAPLRELLEPRAQQFASVGTDIPGAVKQLLTFYDAYERDAPTLIRYLAAQKGIDLRQLAQTPTASASPAAATPPVRPNAPDPVSLIRSEFDRRDAQSHLQAFESKAENKHAKDPEIRRLMAGFIGSVPNITLQEAYDRAVWAVPTIRDQLLADKATEADKAKAVKVAQARTAAVSPRSGGPSGAQPAQLANGAMKGKTVLDAARAAFETHAATR